MIPLGMPAILPHLTVSDVAKSLDYYQRVFGFRLMGEPLNGPEGRLLHGELTHGTGVIMLGAENSFGDTSKAPATSGVEAPMRLYLYVDDVDEHFIRVRDAGGAIVDVPADMFWGDRMYRARCPEGYIWSFASHTGKFSSPA